MELLATILTYAVLNPIVTLVVAVVLVAIAVRILR